MLKQAVIDSFHKFTEPLEGRVYHMYADVLGLITTGVGNLIDPKPAAMVLPWKTQTGDPASSAQVSHEWDNIKAHAAELAHRSLAVQATFTSVRLDDAGIDTLVAKKLVANAEHLAAKHFTEFADFPADAQLACMSLAWAVGADWPSKFTTLASLIRKRDWAGCVKQDGAHPEDPDHRVCDIRVGEKGHPDYNPGVIPRNHANRLCFANAAGVAVAELDPEALHWPNDAGDEAPLYK